MNVAHILQIFGTDKTETFKQSTHTLEATASNLHYAGLEHFL